MHSYSEFTKELQKQTNYCTTENGAITLKSSLDDCVDFFYATLDSKEDYYKKFRKALSQNREVALKTLFWHRDIRQNGMGRRANFRQVLTKVDDWKEEYDFSLEALYHYGRSDDALSLMDTKMGKEVLKLIKRVLKPSSKNEFDENLLPSTPSAALIAKWLPRESSKKEGYRFLARRIARFLGWSSKEYRKKISALTNVVEQQMVSGKWNEINFSHVPSQASLRYKNCFLQNANENYRKWQISLTEGSEAKVNTTTLSPHQIIDKYGCMYIREEDRTLEAMWRAIPKIESNCLVVADTSGSMCGTPMAVSLALALYFAERNPYKGFITFSSEPTWHTINPEDTLQDKLESIKSINIQNTNLQATFDLLLETYESTQMMPETILIVSDMQFDQAIGHNDHKDEYTYRRHSFIDKTSFFKKMKKRFESLGVPFPSIVFWNVKESTTGCPVSFDETGTALISGYNPSVMQSVMNCEELNPRTIMLEAISNINPTL